MQTIKLKHPHPPLDLPPICVALGFFDGVHRGHNKVIETAKDEAKKQNLKSAVMTFYPHPKEVLRKDEQHKVQYLTSLSEKEKLIGELGVDYLFIVEFSLEFAALTPQQFVDQYLIDLNVKHVVAGFDYTYGSLGKGTMETLPFHSRNQFKQTTVNKVELQCEKISSTAIREGLSNGDIQLVNQYLGRRYTIGGKVEHGEKRGRTIGFPTANIGFLDKIFLPAVGVYVVFININGEWKPGVCNIGYKPTFHNDAPKPTVEVHILDFNETIYGLTTQVSFVERIRGEKKFQSINELIEQISQDIEHSRRFLYKLDR